jgi:hypothetical protein
MWLCVSRLKPNGVIQMFENLNSYKNLQYLSARSEKGLQDLIVQITVPIQVINIYSHNGLHVCWFISDHKITIK